MDRQNVCEEWRPGSTNKLEVERWAYDYGERGEDWKQILSVYNSGSRLIGLHASPSFSQYDPLVPWIKLNNEKMTRFPNGVVTDHRRWERTTAYFAVNYYHHVTKIFDLQRHEVLHVIETRHRTIHCYLETRSFPRCFIVSVLRRRNRRR
jgi:hypothetical protein